MLVSGFFNILNQPHNIKLFYRTLNLIITTDFYKNKVSHHNR